MGTTQFSSGKWIGLILDEPKVVRTFSIYYLVKVLPVSREKGGRGKTYENQGKERKRWKKGGKERTKREKEGNRVEKAGKKMEKAPHNLATSVFL